MTDELLQLKRIRSANRWPINQVALRFLPTDWRGDSEIAVLSLMCWGMENGIKTTPLAPHHPDDTQMMAMICRMRRWAPRRAVAYLVNPENIEGHVVLEADELAAQPTALDAASLLLENLYNAIVVNMP